MKTIYLSALIGALIAVVGYWLVGGDLTVQPLLTAGLVGAGSCGVIGLFLAFTCMEGLVPYRLSREAPLNLAAMRSADSLNGAFIWGSGHINSETRYNFFVRNDDGSLSPDFVPARRYVRIIEDESLKDTGTLVSIYNVKDMSSAWAKWALGLNDYRALHSQEIRVPKGTVTLNFAVS